MATIEERRAQQRERHISRIMRTCVHFTGIQYESCKADVNYHAQFGTGAGCFANIPCTYEDQEKLKGCELAKYPTREEAEREESDREASTKRSLRAMIIAHEDAKTKGYGEGHGGTDSVKCPLCPDGVIRYSVASYNGHMHAACTSGCVSWME